MALSVCTNHPDYRPGGLMMVGDAWLCWPCYSALMVEGREPQLLTVPETHNRTVGTNEPHEVVEDVQAPISQSHTEGAGIAPRGAYLRREQATL